MGFHVCEYCRQATSSGDVTLNFSNGSSYVMPDMILHYVEIHNFLPDEQFVSDVETGYCIIGKRMQTRGIQSKPKDIGYLVGEFTKGSTSDLFKENLRKILAQVKTV